MMKSDLISRQDAVNTIKRYKHRLEGRGQTYGFLLEEFEHRIPSVQTDGDLISRADAVKEFIKLFGCIQDVSDIDEWADICQTTVCEVPSAEAEPSLKAIKRQIDEHWYLDPPSAEPTAEEVWSVAQKVFHSTLTYREAVDYVKELEKQHERFNQQSRCD